MQFLRGVLLAGGILSFLASIASAALHQHQHGHAVHDHIHKRDHAYSTALNTRDTNTTPLAVEFINNTPNNDIHVYIFTNYENNGFALITSATTYFCPAELPWNTKMMTPAQANNGILLGGQESITRLDSIPLILNSSRIFVSEGPMNLTQDVASLFQPDFNWNSAEYNSSWGFVEANLGGTCMYVNPTFVDFAGLPLDFDLEAHGDVFEYTGLGSIEGYDEVCQQFAAEQAKDSQLWSNLCLKDANGTNLRIVSPEHSTDFAKFWDDYVDRVWDYYSTRSLTFRLNNDAVECRTDVSRQVMTCNGTIAEFAKPGTSETWGCVGPTTFRHLDPRLNSIGPAFCAAFHRGTLLIEGGDMQPSLRSDRYYPADQTHNKYARILHERQFNHTGYAFPYDDVTAAWDDDASGLQVGENSTCLRIYVGGRYPGKSFSPSNATDVSASTSKSTGASAAALPPSSGLSSLSTAAGSALSSPSASPITNSSWSTSTTPTVPPVSSPASSSRSQTSINAVGTTSTPLTSAPPIQRYHPEAPDQVSVLSAKDYPAKQGLGEQGKDGVVVVTDWAVVTQYSTVTKYVRMARRTAS